MIQRDSALNHDLNSSSTASSPAAGHMDSPVDVAMTEAETHEERLNRVGMESATKSQHRQQHNEGAIFSK
jgi:hypothetical protein